MLKKLSVISFAAVLVIAAMTHAWGASSAPASSAAPAATTAPATAEHPGKSFIEQHGYDGPSTCENCHPGKAAEFLKTVHWRHRSPAYSVKEGVDPKQEYGMYNRIYSFCNGNDVVNRLKETPVGTTTKKATLTGCNSCHPGNNIYGPDSSGKEAEASIDCLVCHSSTYDFSKRKPYKDEKGRVVMNQDRSKEAAMAVGKPGVKNCMACHEKAGGGALIKRGFDFRPENDVHAAKGMVCVDCHKGKNHHIPTGLDPNNWASNNNERISCLNCHDAKPHKKNKYLAADYNRHAERIYCTTCHIPFTGGAYTKDFTVWQRLPSGWYEPTTLEKGVKETVPDYAWFNGQTKNSPTYVGPIGDRKDKNSKIYNFKIYHGKIYINKKTGQPMAMDFADPMATGDVKAGIASAAKTLGIKNYELVPEWQTLYFANSHLVTRRGALTCEKCHSEVGVLDFGRLGYSAKEISKLRSPSNYFDKYAAIKAEENED
jgi:nitrate/TMAO reductase-like tetraheme cytochrome c subunit